MKSAVDRMFGDAAHGVNWALSLLPGSAAVAFEPFPRARGEDDYAVRFAKNAIRVQANTAVGAIGALLEAGKALKGGHPKSITRHLRFRTRNYKHEIRFADKKNPRSALNFTDATWEAICRQIVAHQFNGLTLYAGYHFFEYVLDYKECPQAASQPEADRAAYREALRRALAMAHKYGLKTFIQHYVGHFTPQLVESLNISTTGRLSAVAHPEIERYCRYCYRETFREFPDLDGLYFNFESYRNAYKHILATAVPEFNRMKRKPIAVFRLWDFNDAEGMRKIMKAYKGRVILGHKIPETNDTYHFPSADSRVIQWKQILGPQIEWMFLVGPCHNCGTNLCQQLWADYDFAQTLIDDARRKGSDSFSFHTVNEFFAPDVPNAAGIFSANELAMARYNVLHKQAIVDYVNGRTMTLPERAAYMANRLGVPSRAGQSLLETVHASSQLVLLSFQQFCFGSAYDGFLHPGRYSHIQEPFFYYPGTEMNNQGSRLMWRIGQNTSWIEKTIDTQVAPDNAMQYLLDYVDPAKPNAVRNPAIVAALLRANMAKAERSLVTYGKLAGAAAAAALEPHIRQNALLGEYLYRELLAGVSLYSLYFARTRQAMASALKKGLPELKALRPLAKDKQSPAYHLMARAMLLNPNPEREIALVEEVLSFVERGGFPMPAFQAFVQSRRSYNEIRRVVRPYRRHVPATMRYIRDRLREAIGHAETALAMLGSPKHAHLAPNVHGWLEFLRAEVAHTKPPAAVCPARPGDTWYYLQHDHCFRAGENFLEDFCGFFRPFDYLRPARQSFQMWHAKSEIVVTFREEDVDIAQRTARWEEHRSSGSTAFNTRIFFDVDNRGLRSNMFIIWPKGESVTLDDRPNVPVRTEYTYGANSWQVTARLPFALLGRPPRKGQVWGVNVIGNPAVLAVASRTWAPQYDCNDPLLYGKMRFE